MSHNPQGAPNEAPHHIDDIRHAVGFRRFGG